MLSSCITDPFFSGKKTQKTKKQCFGFVFLVAVLVENERFLVVISIRMLKTAIDIIKVNLPLLSTAVKKKNNNNKKKPQFRIFPLEGVQHNLFLASLYNVLKRLVLGLGPIF